MTAFVWYVPAQVARPVGQVAGSVLSRAVLPTAVGLTQRGARLRTVVLHHLDHQTKRVASAAVGFVLSRVDLVDVVQQHVDLNRLLASIDLNAVLSRIDLVAVAENVVEGVDLGGLIRQSTGAVTSEAVRGVRVQGIEADQAITRAVDHLLHRRRAGNPEVPVQPSAGEDG
jgi:hypothetical protein